MMSLDRRRGILARVLWACALAVVPVASVADAAEASSPGGPVLRALLALVFVFGVMFLLARLFARRGPWTAGAGGHLRVAGALALGQRERVVLLQVGDKQLLVGVAPGRVSLLHALDAPLTTTSEGVTQAAAAHGRGWLGRVIRGREARS